MACLAADLESTKVGYHLLTVKKDRASHFDATDVAGFYPNLDCSARFVEFCRQLRLRNEHWLVSDRRLNRFRVDSMGPVCTGAPMRRWFSALRFSFDIQGDLFSSPAFSTPCWTQMMQGSLLFE